MLFSRAAVPEPSGSRVCPGSLSRAPGLGLGTLRSGATGKDGHSLEASGSHSVGASPGLVRLVVPGFPQLLGHLLSRKLCFPVCRPLAAQACGAHRAFWAGAGVAGGSGPSEKFSVTPSQAWDQDDASQCPGFLTR